MGEWGDAIAASAAQTLKDQCARMHAMTKIQFLLSLTLFSLTLVPAVAAENFECPSPFKPNTPAKLEEIKGLLPNIDAMADIGQLNVTIGTLQREGMTKSLIIDHLVGAYCPLIEREASLTEAEKAERVRLFSGQ